ncbi:MAG: hypothetical protein LBK95_10775 [Bifidobacteriaceae bacterium]|nr:hypothetical protein [Bifidobacteriaceae bacterium]
MRITPTALMVLTVVAALTVGGCAGGGDVVSLGGDGTAEATAGAHQYENAVAMAACLSDAGVPAVTVRAEEAPDQAWLVLDTPHSLQSLLPDGTSIWMQSAESMSLDLSSKEIDQVWEVLDQHPDYGQPVEGQADRYHPFLIIASTDYTPELVECLDQTGYSNPVIPPIDPAEELAQKQLRAEASARWAQCARDNGFPTTKDPAAPKADQFLSEPAALLPVNITETQLRVLFETCSPLDTEAQAAQDAAKNELGDNATQAEWDRVVEANPVIDPLIGIDAPGCRGIWGEIADPEADAIYDTLLRILHDYRNADDPLLKSVHDSRTQG